MRINKLILIGAVLLIFTLVCIKNINFSQKQQTSNIKYINIAGQTLEVELAVDEEAQIKGLSGRAKLKDGRGMLFIFDYPDRYSFWMKDMNFPIDIIWIAEDLKVVYIKNNALPSSYPESFIPDLPANYVLEVPANFSEENNLNIGDTLEFLR